MGVAIKLNHLGGRRAVMKDGRKGRISGVYESYAAAASAPINPKGPTPTIAAVDDPALNEAPWVEVRVDGGAVIVVPLSQLLEVT